MHGDISLHVTILEVFFRTFSEFQSSQNWKL